jgi:predicted transcriptional regulator
MKTFNRTISTKKLRKIKGKMRELDITNRSIARKVGVGDSMVSMVLNGTAKSRKILDAVINAIQGA